MAVQARNLHDIQTRVAALEWALEQLPIVLAGEAGIQDSALPQWLYLTADRALEKGVVEPRVHAAITLLADRMSGIPEGLPAYLKQLRRDHP